MTQCLAVAARFKEHLDHDPAKANQTALQEEIGDVFSRAWGVRDKSKLQITEKEGQLTEAVELLSAHESNLATCEKIYKELEERLS